MNSFKFLGWQRLWLGLAVAFLSFVQIVITWPDYLLVYQYYFSPILVTFGGMLSLVILYGVNGFKSLLKPMIKGSIKRVIFGFLLANLIVFIFAGICMLFHISGAEHSFYRQSPTKTEQLIFIVTSLIQIPGEELIMATFTLPMIEYIHNKGISTKSAWIWANLIGCFIFMLMHLPAYDYNLASVIMVGLGRYPFTSLWHQTQSLRGGIYVHLLFDLIRTVPRIFL
ncbi:CPBP family glutamic-type intramembrane protease [Convivina praedatoris]|uniref:CAAX prenyl protease 2/Lysostaphin resistance protein A-like domain-containing protein n=1 Tax=Convivina praedatoris TaxID=2880963 RepID=A0ABM9D2W7_9LACO|nr:CPBP family glutamic-type intramembrane protease [Convivina sp. LMG 32447]CAH1855905.1 hypothetical protein R077815_01306 [Convivina sp. LMG 32447]CAH1856598.1 hypothetical protein LMG032447_01324 [Convivina sp. LMG 32447]CAH1856875.1 hypothetical protein R078138_01459 [Convivina sp. LMG 32447]